MARLRADTWRGVQVHVARLHNGTKVAVKVQHEGVDRLMHDDIRNMLVVCQMLERWKIDLHFDQGIF